MHPKHVLKVQECLKRRLSRKCGPGREEETKEKWTDSVKAVLALFGGFLIQLTLGSYYRQVYILKIEENKLLTATTSICCKISLHTSRQGMAPKWPLQQGIGLCKVLVGPPIKHLAPPSFGRAKSVVKVTLQP